MNLARYKYNTDSLIYLFGAAFSQGAFIIIAPLVIAHLGQETFAELEMLAIIVQLAVIVFGINIHSGLPRLLIELNELQRKKYLNVVISYVILLTALVALFMFFSAQILSNYLPREYMVFVPFLFFVNMLYYSWNDWCSVNKMSLKFALTQILGGLFKVLIVYYFIQFNLFSFKEKLYSDIIGISLGSFFLIKKFRFRLDKDELRSLLTFSAPMALYSLCVFFLRFYDQFMVSRFFGKVELSYYTMAVKFSLLLLVVYKALSNHFNIDYFDKRSKNIATTKQTIVLISVMFFFSMALKVIFWYYVKLFIPDLVLEKAHSLLELNVVTIFIFCMFLIFAREALFLKRTMRLVLPIIAGITVSFVLNTYFLRGKDIYFALNTALYSSIVVFLFQVLLYLKYFSRHKVELIFSVLCVLLLYLF